MTTPYSCAASNKYDRLDPFTRVEVAAKDLAASLAGNWWYHRTSFASDIEDRRTFTYLVVWGEGKRPASVPQEFAGYHVAYNRVSRRNPCPFGSVKSGFGKPKS